MPEQVQLPRRLRATAYARGLPGQLDRRPHRGAVSGERLSKCACEYRGYVGHAASTRYRGHACSLTLTHLCQAIDDDCVAAYHSCPSNGVSLQIDSEGIVIAVEPRHNSILFAYCVCTDEWSGNDCTIPPPEPPTEQPWPDPYENYVESAAPRGVRRPTLMLGGALSLAAAVTLGRGGISRRSWGG